MARGVEGGDLGHSAAEDGAKLKTDRGRSVYALLMSAAPFSWPSPKPNTAATHQPHQHCMLLAIPTLGLPWLRRLVP